MTWNPTERAALESLLDSDLYRRSLVTVPGFGQVERWTSPTGAFTVDFPVPGDTSCVVVDQNGTTIMRAIDADVAWLEDVLP